MKVTATELARNARGVLDRVAAGRETVLVERNRTVVARITPVTPGVTVSQALAELRPLLTARQAAAWQRDSRQGFGERVRDPWA